MIESIQEKHFFQAVLVAAVWLLQGCITHQVVCPSNQQACKTHQALVLHATDRLLEEGRLDGDTASELVNPFLEGQGFERTGEYSWHTDGIPSGQAAESSFNISVPGTDTPCFRNALPHWLTWMSQMPSMIRDPIALTMHNSPESASSFQFSLKCGEEPGTLVINMSEKKHSATFEEWLMQLRENYPHGAKLIFQNRNGAN